MFQELTPEELESVSGGRYVVNGKTNQVMFRDIKESYKLKNCTPFQAMEAMDSLIGKYASEAEYDAACVALLRNKGWI